MKPTILFLAIFFMMACGDYKDPYANDNTTNNQVNNTEPSSNTDSKDAGTSSQEEEEQTQTTPKAPTAESNSVSEEIFNAIADHRLHKFSQYNSGGGGEGMQSTTWLDLCANGKYFFYNSSSVYINGDLRQSEESEEGTWKITGSGNDFGILFRNQKGEEAGPVKIYFEEGKFFMDGQRWLRAAKGEENGPQTCL